MEGVSIRLWVETPVRYQKNFVNRVLDDCVLEHLLYALPGPQCSEKPARKAENEANVDEEFTILLDVVQFRPEDIIIQIFEGWLIIKGEHGRRMDEHGFISRSFTRSYKLPTGIRSKDLFAVFCHDGILAVEIRP